MTLAEIYMKENESSHTRTRALLHNRGSPRTQRRVSPPCNFNYEMGAADRCQGPHRMRVRVHGSCSLAHRSTQAGIKRWPNGKGSSRFSVKSVQCYILHADARVTAKNARVWSFIVGPGEPVAWLERAPRGSDAVGLVRPANRITEKW